MKLQTLFGSLSRLHNAKSRALFIVGSLPCLFYFAGGNAFAQVSPLTSCAVSECKFNQTTGTTNSIGVGVSSSFGVSASAQSTPSFNATASGSLLLNPDINSSAFKNSSIQSIGSQGATSPININITSDSISTKSKDGSTNQQFNQTNQNTTSSDFADNTTTKSNATFKAEGFSASQTLNILGSGAEDGGSEYSASVTPIVLTDANGKTILPQDPGSASSSSSAETRSRFQSDITTSSFVNAFMSSY